MKKRIFFKLYSGFLTVTLILSGLILLVTYIEIRYTYVKAVGRDLVNVVNALNLSVTPLFRTKDLKPYLAKLDEQLQERITVISPDGTVIFDTQKDQSEMVNHKSRPEVAEALKGNTGTAVRFSKTLQKDMLYAAVPIKKNGEIEGVLRVSRALSSINTLINVLEYKIVLLTLFVIIIALVSGFLVFRRLVRPIIEMRNAAHILASGDFSARVHAGLEYSETKELSDTFNSMAEKIESLFLGLTDRTQKLDALISSLYEELFVFSKDGKITLANKRFKETVKDTGCEGRYYWEYFRDTGFEQLVKTAHETKVNSFGEMEFSGNTFLISISALSASGDTVVIMHNITAERNLEKIKRDFVANVSHELRTPLTAIKGFVETMEGDVSEANKRYLGIIKKHAERLINIVADLLTLSELEEKKLSLESGEVDLEKLIDDVVSMFQPKISEKKLQVKVNSDAKLPHISGDIFRLEQLFVNLIDNAVKYTDKGKISINLSLLENKIIVTVEDTGIGIPKEHLPRVFERFYVADRGRSKKSGGTGLGLAIVKHIAMLHHGAVDVESTLSIGTKFTVSLPIK
ncbi:MAG: ATP-binding protein [Elusimicrobia bacterium]|nr:ATP-binding protein [Elusimicrobiota bacterium]